MGIYNEWIERGKRNEMLLLALGYACHLCLLVMMFFRIHINTLATYSK